MWRQSFGLLEKSYISGGELGIRQLRDILGMLPKEGKERGRIGWIFPEANKDGNGQEVYRIRVGKRVMEEKGS